MGKNIFILTIILLVVNFLTSAQERISLSKAFKIAEENSPFLKAERFKVTEAEAAIKIAKVRPNVEFNTQDLSLVENFREDKNKVSFFNQQNWVQLTKPLQLGGQRRLGILAANQAKTIEELKLKDFERGFQAQLAHQWLEVWFQQERINLLNHTVKMADSLILLLSDKYVDDSSEKIRMRLLRDDYHFVLNQAERDFENSLISLKLSLGINRTIHVENIELMESIFIPSNLDSLITHGILLRPELAQNKENQKLAKTQELIEIASIWGTPVTGVIYNPQNTVNYLGMFLTVQLPVFNQRKGEIQQSKIAQERTLNEQTLLQQQVEAEIRLSYNDYTYSLENLLIVKDYYQLSSLDYEVTKTEFLKNETIFLDFLDMEKRWYDSRVNLLQSKLEVYKAKISILAACNLLNQSILVGK
jgi:cobalt-zinc-cadmium efflux system outer membrane protein